MVKCTYCVNTVACLLTQFTQLIQIDHVHKWLMLLVWECRVYQMRFHNLCDHNTSNTSITKSSTHLLVINLAWPNICVCQGWGIDRSFDFKLFCTFDCHMQTHYTLFTHICIGDDHLPQQVVGSSGQDAPIVTPQGVLPHHFPGTLSFTI